MSRLNLSILAAWYLLNACSPFQHINFEKEDYRLGGGVRYKQTVLWKSTKIELGDLEKKVILRRFLMNNAPVEESEFKKYSDSKDTIGTTEELLLLPLKEEIPPAYMKMLKEALEDMQSKPKLENTEFTLSVPQRKDDLVDGSLSKRQIGVLADLFYSFSTSIKTSEKKSELLEQESYNRPFYFKYGYSLRFSRDEGYSPLSIVGEPLLVSIGKGDAYRPPDALMSLATVFYAHQLTRATINNITRSLNILYKVHGRGLDPNKISGVGDDWHNKQWMASYALAHLWVSDFGQKTLGLSAEEIDRIHGYPQKFDDVRDTAKKMGPDRFLRTYSDTPELIFKTQHTHAS